MLRLDLLEVGFGVGFGGGVVLYIDMFMIMIMSMFMFMSISMSVSPASRQAGKHKTYLSGYIHIFAIDKVKDEDKIDVKINQDQR